jgi:hypothetical protein
MLGKDRGALQRNVLNDLLELVGKNNYKWVDRMRGEILILNRRVWLVGASTVETEERLRGATFAGAYCDEANTYPEVVWNQLLARLSVPGAQCFANCNPESPHHWFFKNPLTSPHITNRQVWHFTMDDNPNLDTEYKESLIAEYKGSPTFYRRFVLGEWVVAEGAIYLEFTNHEDEFFNVTYHPAIDVLSTANFAMGKSPQPKVCISPGTPQEKWLSVDRISIGVDWGQNKSAHAFVATAITEGFQHLVVLRSARHVATGSTPNDVLNWFIAFADSIAEDFGHIHSVYCDGTEQLLLNMLRQNTPYPIKNAAKLEIVDRIRVTVALLGQRRIHFLNKTQTASVQDFLRAARYKEGALKDIRLDDGSYDMDTGDAFEYSFERYMHYLARKGGYADGSMETYSQYD